MALMTASSKSLQLLFVVLGCAVSAVLGDTDPTWQDTVREAREVSKLSDDIERTQRMIHEWEMKHAKAKAYHEGQKELIKEQIEIRKDQTESQDDELDGYEESKEEYYRYRMCSLLLEAFFFGEDKDSKLHVLHLCIGRKTLALQHQTSQLGQHHHHDHVQKRRRLRKGPSKARARRERLWDEVLDRRLGVRLGEIERQVHALVLADRSIKERGVSSKLIGPVQRMEKRLASLEAELVAIRAKYSADSARWRKERRELSATEGAAGQEVNSNYAEKEAAKKRAWSKVKGEFCPTVMAEYGHNEDAIIDHAMDKCQ